MAPKTYSNAELNALISEFSTEFDALVKSEVAKGESLAKAEGDSDGDEGPPKKEASSPPVSDASADASPPAGSPPPADASASTPPEAPPDAAAASPEAPGATAADPMEALKQAYKQLSPEELQQHVLALSEVMKAQQASAAPAPVPDAMGAGAPAGMPPPPPAAGAPAPAAPAMAGEGSKPVDPMSTMALKSELEKEIKLIKAERDAANSKAATLEESVMALTDTLTKAISQPTRKALTGKDIDGLLKSEQKPVTFDHLSRTEITRKLTAVAKTELKKSDRELINNFYKGTVKVDALAHLLG